MYTFLYTQYVFACTQSTGSQVGVVSFLGDICQCLETFLFVLAEVWGAPGICRKSLAHCLSSKAQGSLCYLAQMSVVLRLKSDIVEYTCNPST